jgi:atypical dual specificity phosphatase
MARPDGRPEDIEELRTHGIGAVVNLTRRNLEGPFFGASGLNYLHIPITDFMPPTLAQIEEFVRFCDAQIARGRAVAAHCVAGRGRTGTMLACYLVHCGMTADAAIRRVRELRPGSVETYEQEQAVKEYAQSRPADSHGHGASSE